MHDISTNQGRRGAAMDFMHDEMGKDDSSEHEKEEFEDAKIEEVEDTLLATQKKKKRPLAPEEVEKMS